MPRPSRKPVPPPDMPDLTYRGLDWCDGCGGLLQPGEWLSGLCAACQKPAEPVSRTKAREKGPD